MIDIFKITPGDVIHRCNCDVWDQDVPVFVVASGSTIVDDINADYGGVVVQILGIYMVRSGDVLVEEFILDADTRHDYEHVM